MVPSLNGKWSWPNLSIFPSASFHPATCMPASPRIIAFPIFVATYLHQHSLYWLIIYSFTIYFGGARLRMPQKNLCDDSIAMCFQKARTTSSTSNDATKYAITSVSMATVAWIGLDNDVTMATLWRVDPLMGFLLIGSSAVLWGLPWPAMNGVSSASGLSSKPRLKTDFNWIFCTAWAQYPVQIPRFQTRPQLHQQSPTTSFEKTQKRHDAGVDKKKIRKGNKSCRDMGVSKNNGTPQIIHFNRVFHYKSSILGVLPLFLETPIWHQRCTEHHTKTFQVAPEHSYAVQAIRNTTKHSSNCMDPQPCRLSFNFIRNCFWHNPSSIALPKNIAMEKSNVFPNLLHLYFPMSIPQCYLRKSSV